jgi:phage terminase large subunit
MNIEISEKYAPLFDLPKGIDTIIITGGRYSQKSFAVGLAVCHQTAINGHRCLYTRYTLTSADDSIVPEFNEKIDMLGFENHFEVTKGRINVRHNKGKIVFKGIKTSSGNQTASLKSLKDFSMFVLEEAEEHPSYEDWDKVKKSIRSFDVPNVSILVLNPTTKEHWVYTEFFEKYGIKEGFNGTYKNVLYIHTTYHDMPRKFIADNIYKEFEEKRIIYEYYNSLSQIEKELQPNSVIRDYKYYKHTILGGWLDRQEGVIYENWQVGEFPENEPSIFGLDFGSNDPDALTEVVVDQSQMKIYIRELYFKNNTSFDALKRILEDRVGFVNLIIADSAERRMIKDLWDAGFNIERCRKGKDSVKHRIKTLQAYTLIVCPNSLNLQKALNNYRWHDSKSGIPNHDWSDLCDSFGYAAMDIIDNNGSEISW